MTNLDQHAKALDLATRIATYCHVNALSLGGLVADIDEGAIVDSDMAARLVAYCAEHNLTLGGLIVEVQAMHPNPCHMVCEGVADPIGEAIAEDAALRFKMGHNADGGVTLSRQPERKTLDQLEAENPEGFRNPGEFEPVVSKVQQVGQYVALKMAYEVIRQTGHAVAVSVEIVPFGDNALHYIITSPKGEKVKLLCSSTSFERLAQMAALLAKGE